MIKLFNLDDYEVVVEPEALLLSPFKTLYDRDKRKDKSLAKQELAYCFFMGDPRSDYQYIIDEEVRSEEIIKALGMPKGWKPDEKVNKALVFYKSFKPASAALLEDTRFFVESFRKELRERSTDLTGLEMKDLKEALNLVKQLPGIVKDLDEAERTLSKDIMAETRARGSQSKGLFEDEQ